MYRSTSLEESIKSMSLSPEEDDIPWKDLRDNRDLTVLFNWDPKDRWVEISSTVESYLFLTAPMAKKILPGQLPYLNVL